MFVRTYRFAAAILCATLSSCSLEPSDSADVVATPGALRSITHDEATNDFEQLVSAVRVYYGALPRKEQRYGFSFEVLVDDYRAQLAAATTEPEYFALFSKLLEHLKDAHVAILSGAPADEARYFTLPLVVMPIEDSFVVYLVRSDIAEIAPFARGDELLAIDGVPAAELADRFSVYDGAPNPLFLRHIAAQYFTFRPPWVSSGLENGQPVVLTLRGADGHSFDASLTWSEVPHALPPVTAIATPADAGATFAISAAAERVTRAELQSYGATVPFYLTSEVKTEFDVVENVVPSEDVLAKFHVTPEVAARQRFTAFVYPYRDRRILVLRVPDYLVEGQAIGDAANYLRALFFEQTPHVDGLIIDQTHNPGGTVEFASTFASLFAPEPIHGIVQQMHADRRWIDYYASLAQQARASSAEADPPEALALEAYAHQIDVAYSTGLQLSAPIPLPGAATTIDPDPHRWRKPILLLADELSTSAADTVPLLFKVNHIAPIFGQRTTGAGGTVEPVAVLPNSDYTLYLSRGLVTTFDPTGEYPEENFIEDLGVTPDIEYSHTLTDFRAGYVGYVRAFSDALVDEIHRCE